MQVIERAKMPDGTRIQIENWHDDYSFMPYAGMVAAYPMINARDLSPFAPKDKSTCRVDFNYDNEAGARNAFEKLKSGEKSLADFKDNLGLKELADYIWR